MLGKNQGIPFNSSSSLYSLASNELFAVERARFLPVWMTVSIGAGDLCTKSVLDGNREISLAEIAPEECN